MLEIIIFIMLLIIFGPIIISIGIICLPFILIYAVFKIASSKPAGNTVNENRTKEESLPPTPQFTSQDIRNMNPRDFEVFVAKIFSDNGYSTKVTQYTSDGGKDIIIKKNCITYYVECKHWESAVGRPELQKLVGAAVGSNVSDLIFISTGGFNVNAINYANSVNSNGNVHLDLWTMEDILKIANKKMKIEHRS